MYLLVREIVEVGYGKKYSRDCRIQLQSWPIYYSIINVMSNTTPSIETTKTEAVETHVITVQVPAATKQPYNAAVDILDKAFTFFNEKLFSSQLETHPVITIQSKGRKNAYGWFWASKWKDGEERRCEINISAEELARTATSIFETLIHEMVHQLNWQRKVADCSVNQYHNKRFKTACEEVSLKCEQLANYGWAKTSLEGKSAEIVSEFIAKIDGKVFDSFKRMNPTRNYRPVWTVPVSEEDKNWIEQRSAALNISQKELISTLIRGHVQPATPNEA